MKINLSWYRRKNQGNFGDELGPWIIAKLSGKKINYVLLSQVESSKFRSIKSIIKNLLKFNYSVLNINKHYTWVSLLNREVIISVGSIISWYTYKNVTVWGSGIINEDANIVDANFLAVRGTYTQKRIAGLGYKAPTVLGDPALLLDLIFMPKNEKKFLLGVIPHVFHFDYLNSSIKNQKIKVIDLLNSIEDIIEQINSCQYILSTSLHGLIVSHTYRVPAVWVEFAECTKKLNGDGVKFKDYFSSVDIKEYEPFLLSVRDLNEFQTFTDIIKEEYGHFEMPALERIKHVQRELLSVAPFAIKEEYKGLLRK